MSGWKPIETAPKDGTRVDLWTSEGRVPNAFWRADHWTIWLRWKRDSTWRSGPPKGAHVYTNVVGAVTHWQPLPPPPTLEEIEGNPR